MAARQGWMHSPGGDDDARRQLRDVGALDTPARAVLAAAAGDAEALSGVVATASEWKQGPQDTRRLLLHLASVHSDAAAVRVLLGAGVRGDWRDAAGMTALHHAARAGRQSCLEALVGAAEDVSGDAWRALQDRDGRTCLHFAAAHGHAACVATLVSHGASVDTRCVGHGRGALVPCPIARLGTRTHLPRLTGQEIRWNDAAAGSERPWPRGSRVCAAAACTGLEHLRYRWSNPIVRDRTLLAPRHATTHHALVRVWVGTAPRALLHQEPPIS